MIYDCVTYNGEKDILDLRFNILYPYVDKFIIIEFDETFSGKKKKKLLLKDWNKDWVKFVDKIDYGFISNKEYNKYEELAESSPNVPQSPAHWKREFCQKESIKDALTDLQDEDIVFIGDVDEIWNPAQLKEFLINPCKLKLDVYTYFLNNRSSEEFWGTIVAQYKDIKDTTLNHIRTSILPRTEKEFGWHFTSMGGYETVKKKLEDSYTADSYANPNVIQGLQQNMIDNKDFLWRKFQYQIDESNLPHYLRNNKNKYLHLFKK